jgi:hypothetical protein
VVALEPAGGDAVGEVTQGPLEPVRLGEGAQQERVGEEVGENEYAEYSAGVPGRKAEPHQHRVLDARRQGEEAEAERHDGHDDGVGQAQRPCAIAPHG